MPWKSTWFDAPTDMSKPVLKEKPTGSETFRHPLWRPEVVLLGLTAYYHCRYCDGWIEGEPNEYPIHTIGFLSGRDGTEFYCCRCGQEIGFVGRQS